MARRRAPSDSGTQKGRDTVDSILVAAEDVLITVGCAGFTARAVAGRADIAPGNLTYHFRTLDELQRALIASVLRRYLHRWEAFSKGHDRATRSATSVGGVLEWLIGDAVDPRTTRLFRELWAMALRSKAAAASMDDFYSQGVNAAAGVLHQLFPHLTNDAALDLAYLMAVVSEGSIVLFGTLPASGRRVRALRALATAAVESLAARPSARASRARRPSTTGRAGRTGKRLTPGP